MLFSNFIKPLAMFDEPPTLYSFMESIVNYNKPITEKVKIKDLSSYARTTIFDFNYPVSNLFGKEQFEVMFLNHYMFRRINFDTLRSFQIHLMVKLNDIMPKYNKMIEGFDELKFDGFVETHERTQTDTNTSSSNLSTTSTDSSINDNRYSDTPQGELEAVQDGTYLTDYTYNQVNSNSSSGTNSTSNNIGNTNENITIKRADSIDEYNKYINNMNNIYSMIFKECDSLFYGVI